MVQSESKGKHKSYGNTVKDRAKCLLEALLGYVNYEFEEDLDIEYKWEPEDSNNLNITTTLQDLVALTEKDKKKNKYDKKIKNQIRQALREHLKEYLGILVDNRSQTKGSDKWIFTLKLWSRNKDQNLEEFDKLWEEKRQGKSKDLASKEQKEKDEWREIFHNKLEKQLQFIRTKATEWGFEVNVHVPLGLVERKQQQRRDKDCSPVNPYELEKEVIVKIYEHHAFLQEVIGVNSAEKKKHIGIIGEAGAGKTTLLSKVAEYLKNETEYFPIWISLADLQGETLENYFLETWFPDIKDSNKCSITQDDLKKRFDEGDIWLLLDGVDEMAESSPLNALKIEILPDWLRKARFVLTCRLNVWDEKVNNPLTGFETYKTQEFKPEQVDEFIQYWFECAEIKEKGSIEKGSIEKGSIEKGSKEKGSIEKGTALQTKLKESRQHKIRSLVTNPLRLSLLCQTFYLDKQGELPETKAELYEKFTRYFYEWKSQNIPEDLRNSDEKQDELHQALSKLALAGINSDTRFRLKRKIARKQMGEELFKLACDVGWLNLVDRNARNDEEVYAFFHANFQEYFAALAVDDWDYFLPRAHDNNNPQSVADRYRIFEPQWKEVILLWLGRDEDDVSDSKKSEFIQALVEFEDGCCDKNLPHVLKSNYLIVNKGFYKFRAYFLAAAGIAEFKDCDLTNEIVQQIVEWGFRKFNREIQKWEEFIYQIKNPAEKLIQETNRENAINALVELIHNQDVDYHTKYYAAQSLGKIDPRNENAINALVELIRNQDVDYSTKYNAAQSLGGIAVGNQNAINALVDLIRNQDVDNHTKCYAAQSLGKIDPRNENAINALVELIRNQDVDYSTKYNAAQSLGGIAVGNQNAINALLESIRNQDVDSYTKIYAAKNLGKIDPRNENAINALVDLIHNQDVDFHTKYYAAQNLGEIDPRNENAINALVDLIRNQDVDFHTKFYAPESLGKIAVGNQNAINALFDLIRNQNVDFHTKYYAAESLGKIAVGDENAISALVDLIRNQDVDFHTKYKAAERLGKIDPRNENAINALVELIRNQDVDYPTKYHAAQSLGKIAVGNENAINALVELIRNQDVDYPTKYHAAQSLREILTDKHMSDIIKALTPYLSLETYNNSPKLFRVIYEIIWKCAENMTYPEFYQAWYQRSINQSIVNL